MNALLNVEASFENIDTYDGRELMYMAWETKQMLNANSMPEVDLVERILKIPTAFGPKIH